MEFDHLQSKADEMATGWDELLQHVQDRQVFLTFVTSTLHEHHAETVRDLPRAIQRIIAIRDANLKSDEWLEAEQERLEHLGQEIFPEVAMFIECAGPVN